MDTNGVIAAAEMVGGFDQESMGFRTMMVQWSPFMQFDVLANVIVAFAIAWLAIRNIVALSRAKFDPPAARAVECRVAITKYLLLFLGAVWLCMLASDLQWTVMNMVYGDMARRGEAWKALMCWNAQVPAVTAGVLAVLTSIHCAVGILFAVRKSRMVP